MDVEDNVVEGNNDDAVMDQEPEKNSPWWPYPSKQVITS